jgi:hypothetical protein
MLIVFGWGGAPKDFGPTLPTTCPDCHNLTVVHYVRIRRSFRLFFVPVFAYGAENYLLCPVCTGRIDLSPDRAGLAKAVAEAYGSWYADRISDEEYDRRAAPLATSIEPLEQAIQRGRGEPAQPRESLAAALPSRGFGDGASWCPDPSGRHELRFWDGSEWTAYVSDAGTTASDAVLSPSAAGWYPDPERRNVYRHWGRVPLDRPCAERRHTVERPVVGGTVVTSGQAGTTSTGMPFTAWLFDSVS